MAKRTLRKRWASLPLEEKLGHVWGWLYISLIVSLVAVLVGKACLFGG